MADSQLVIEPLDDKISADALLYYPALRNLFNSDEDALRFMIFRSFKQLIELDQKDRNLRCLECGDMLSSPDHVSLWQCCDVMTICRQSLFLHYRRKHSWKTLASKSKIACITQKVNMENSFLLCSCGMFSTENANKMAEHLTKCRTGNQSCEIIHFNTLDSNKVEVKEEEASLKMTCDSGNVVENRFSSSSCSMEVSTPGANSVTVFEKENLLSLAAIFKENLVTSSSASAEVSTSGQNSEHVPHFSMVTGEMVETIIKQESDVEKSEDVLKTNEGAYVRIQGNSIRIKEEPLDTFDLNSSNAQDRKNLMSELNEDLSPAIKEEENFDTSNNESLKDCAQIESCTESSQAGQPVSSSLKQALVLGLKGKILKFQLPDSTTDSSTPRILVNASTVSQNTNSQVEALNRVFDRHTGKRQTSQNNDDESPSLKKIRINPSVMQNLLPRENANNPVIQQEVTQNEITEAWSNLSQWGSRRFKNKLQLEGFSGSDPKSDSKCTNKIKMKTINRFWGRKSGKLTPPQDTNFIPDALTNTEAQRKSKHSLETGKRCSENVENSPVTCIPTIVKTVAKPSSTTVVQAAVKPSLPTVVQAAVKPNLPTVVQAAVKPSLPTTVEATKSSLLITVQATKTSLPTTVQVRKSSLQSAVQAMKSSLPTTAYATKSSLPTTVQATKSNLPTTVQATKSSLPTTVQAMKSSLQSAVQAMKSSLPTTVQAMKFSLQSAVQVGKRGTDQSPVKESNVGVGEAELQTVTPKIVTTNATNYQRQQQEPMMKSQEVKTTSFTIRKGKIFIQVLQKGIKKGQIVISPKNLQPGTSQNVHSLKSYPQGTPTAYLQSSPTSVSNPSTTTKDTQPRQNLKQVKSVNVISLKAVLSQLTDTNSKLSEFLDVNSKAGEDYVISKKRYFAECFPGNHIKYFIDSSRTVVWPQKVKPTDFVNPSVSLNKNLYKDLIGNIIPVVNLHYGNFSNLKSSEFRNIEPVSIYCSSQFQIWDCFFSNQKRIIWPSTEQYEKSDERDDGYILRALKYPRLKNFFTPNKLRASRSIAEEEEKCSICGRIFLLSWELYVHVRHVHYRRWPEKIEEGSLKIKPGATIWESDPDNTNYETSSNRIEFVVPLRGDGKLQCKFCPKSFWHSLYLRNHIAMSHMFKQYSPTSISFFNTKDVDYFDKVANAIFPIKKEDKKLEMEDQIMCLYELSSRVQVLGDIRKHIHVKRVIILLPNVLENRDLLNQIYMTTWKCAFCNKGFERTQLHDQLEAHECSPDSDVMLLCPAKYTVSLENKLYSLVKTQCVTNDQDKISQCVNDSSEKTSQCVNDSPEKTSQCVTDSSDKTSQCVNDSSDKTSQCVNDSSEKTSQCVNDSPEKTSQCVTDSSDKTSQCVTDSSDKTSPCVNDSSDKTLRCVTDSSDKTSRCVTDSSDKTSRCVTYSSDKTSRCVTDSSDKTSQCVNDSSDKTSRCVTDSSDKTSRCVTDSSDKTSRCVTDSSDKTSRCVTDSSDKTSRCVTDSSDKTSRCVTYSSDKTSRCVTDSSDKTSRCVTNSSDKISQCVNDSSDKTLGCVTDSSDKTSQCVTNRPLQCKNCMVNLSSQSGSFQHVCIQFTGVENLLDEKQSCPVPSCDSFKSDNECMEHMKSFHTSVCKSLRSKILANTFSSSRRTFWAYNCPCCTLGMEEASDLQFHLNTDHQSYKIGDSPSICKICNYSCFDPFELADHIKENHQDKFLALKKVRNVRLKRKRSTKNNGENVIFKVKKKRNAVTAKKFQDRSLLTTEQNKVDLSSKKGKTEVMRENVGSKYPVHIERQSCIVPSCGGKVFNSHKQWMKHMENFHTSVFYVTDETKHRLSKKQVKVWAYNCPCCTLGMEEASELQFHLNTDHQSYKIGDSPSICKICNYSCFDPFELADHIKENHQNKLLALKKVRNIRLKRKISRSTKSNGENVIFKVKKKRNAVTAKKIQDRSLLTTEQNKVDLSSKKGKTEVMRENVGSKNPVHIERQSCIVPSCGGKVFNTHKQWMKHMENFHQSVFYVTDETEHRFSTKKVKVWAYNCPCCIHGVEEASTLQFHLKSFHPSYKIGDCPSSCKICSYSCSDPFELADHIKQNHKDSVMVLRKDKNVVSKRKKSLDGYEGDVNLKVKKKKDAEPTNFLRTENDKKDIKVTTQKVTTEVLRKNVRLKYPVRIERQSCPVSSCGGKVFNSHKEWMKHMEIFHTSVCQVSNEIEDESYSNKIVEAVAKTPGKNKEDLLTKNNTIKASREDNNTSNNTVVSWGLPLYNMPAKLNRMVNEQEYFSSSFPGNHINAFIDKSSAVSSPQKLQPRNIQSREVTLERDLYDDLVKNIITIVKDQNVLYKTWPGMLVIEPVFLYCSSQFQIWDYLYSNQKRPDWLSASDVLKTDTRDDGYVLQALDYPIPKSFLEPKKMPRGRINCLLIGSNTECSEPQSPLRKSSSTLSRFKYSHSDWEFRDLKFLYVSTNMKESLECDKCSRKFEVLMELEAHQKYVHTRKLTEKNSDKSLKVKAGDLIWDSVPDLGKNYGLKEMAEMRVPLRADGKLQCKFCRKSFWHSLYLSDHIAMSHMFKRYAPADVVWLTEEIIFFDKISNAIFPIKQEAEKSIMEDQIMCLYEPSSRVQISKNTVNLHPVKRVIIILHNVSANKHDLLRKAYTISWKCALCNEHFKKTQLHDQLEAHECSPEADVLFICPIDNSVPFLSLPYGKESSGTYTKELSRTDTKESSGTNNKVNEKSLKSLLQCKLCKCNLSGPSAYVQHMHVQHGKILLKNCQIKEHFQASVKPPP